MPDCEVMDHDLKVMMPGKLKGVDFTPLELRLRADLSMEDWAEVGRRLCRSDRVMQWWLGDWARFGAGDQNAPGWRKYGRLKEFAEANGLDYQTLRNLAWVSGRVELSRRRDSVEWTKHAEVAALPPKEQEKWLAKTDKEELPRAELRRQIRQSQAEGDNNALASDGPIMKFAHKACDDLVNWLKQRPEDFWSEDRRAAWRKRLQPVVDFYNRL